MSMPKRAAHIVGEVGKYAPGYLIMVVIEGLLMGVNQSIGIFHTKEVFDLLWEGAGFAPIACILLEFALYLLLHYAFYHWFKERYQPHAREHLHVMVAEHLLEYAGDLNDRPYHETAPATRRIADRVDQILEHFGRVITHIVAVLAITAVLIWADRGLALVCIAVSVVRLVIAAVYDHLNVRHTEQVKQLDKQRHDLLAALNIKGEILRDYHERKRQLFTQGNRKLWWLTFVTESGMMAADLGIILWMLHGLMVTHTVHLGTVAVSATALWVLSWQLRGLYGRTVRLLKSVR